MHDNSLTLMKQLIEDYAKGLPAQTVIDVGSANINGTYKSLVLSAGHQYLGIDMCSADNVDVVVPESPRQGELLDLIGFRSKLVISGQCLEHTRFPWVWIERVTELVDDGGILILIAPFIWPEHKYPIDCWRFLPDGMGQLATWAGLELLASGLSPNENGWCDCFSVMRRR